MLPIPAHLLKKGGKDMGRISDARTSGTSYGTCNIMWQVDLCRKLGLPYLYLGYWISECRKMSYKSNFRPLQGLVQGVWQTLPEKRGAPPQP